MRILIVGAGIAGLTLAALLKQRGIVPMVIDKKPNLTDADHMLGIYPNGSRVLHGLGLMDEFMSRSVSSDTHVICKGDGSIIHQLPLAKAFAPYGSNRACSRTALIDVLLDGCADVPIYAGTVVNSIKQTNQVVNVELSNGSHVECDLVVGADGTHSQVRELILTPQEVSHFDTGWGGWMWCSDDSHLQPNTVMEFWGRGNMLGIYPAENKHWIFAIAPRDNSKMSVYPELRSDLRQAYFELARSYPVVFEHIPVEEDGNISYWPLQDVRANHWCKKRVVLLGDAAAGFMPTSDLGAVIAMESAAVLADELSRADAKHLDWALYLFQRRRRARVLIAQDNARKVTKQMFVTSMIGAYLRDYRLKKYSLSAFAERLKKIFQLPI
jgi:2-polyprenyl-6-methoxyphenol hydroxylase-like FAD-dependent oxidoreductase